MKPTFVRILFMLVLGLAALTLAAAQGSQTMVQTLTAQQRPIVNVSNYPFGLTKPARLEQISQAIVRAGARRGWSIVQVRPGVLVGTLNIRTHQAAVDIVHDTSTFSITYKSSSNLLYDADRQVIHRNFNIWIQNLRGDIMSEAAII